MPALSELQANYGEQGVEVLAIDIQPGRGGVNSWIDNWRRYDDRNVTWASDGSGNLVRKYGNTALGQTGVINKSSNVVYNGRGLSCKSLTTLVEES